MTSSANGADRGSSPPPPPSGESDGAVGGASAGGMAGGVAGVQQVDSLPETMLRSWQLVRIDDNQPVINALTRYSRTAEEAVEFDGVVNGNIVSGPVVTEGDRIQVPNMLTTAMTPENDTPEGMLEEALVLGVLQDAQIIDVNEDRLILQGISSPHRLTFSPGTEQRLSQLKEFKAEKEAALDSADYLYAQAKWQKDIRKNVTGYIVESFAEMKILDPTQHTSATAQGLSGSWNLVAVNGVGDTGAELNLNISAMEGGGVKVVETGVQTIEVTSTDDDLSHGRLMLDLSALAVGAPAGTEPVEIVTARENYIIVRAASGVSYLFVNQNVPRPEPQADSSGEDDSSDQDSDDESEDSKPASPSSAMSALKFS